MCVWCTLICQESKIASTYVRMCVTCLMCSLTWDMGQHTYTFSVLYGPLDRLPMLLHCGYLIPHCESLQVSISRSISRPIYVCDFQIHFQTHLRM